MNRRINNNERKCILLVTYYNPNSKTQSQSLFYRDFGQLVFVCFFSSYPYTVHKPVWSPGQPRTVLRCDPQFTLFQKILKVLVKCKKYIDYSFLGETLWATRGHFAPECLYTIRQHKLCLGSGSSVELQMGRRHSFFQFSVSLYVILF